MSPPTTDVPDFRAFSSLPKLDKSQRIKAFVKSQAIFLSCYALQGRKVLCSARGAPVDNASNLDDRSSRSRQNAQKPPAVLPPGAFSSPVLKPRVSLSENRVEPADDGSTSQESEVSAPSNDNPSDCQLDHKIAKTKEDSKRSKGKANVPGIKNTIQDPRSKKRKPEFEDKETAARK